MEQLAFVEGLEQDLVGPGVQECASLVGLQMGADGDDARLRTVFCQGTDGARAARPIEARHAGVEQHEFDPVLAVQRQCLLAVVRFQHVQPQLHRQQRQIAQVAEIVVGDQRAAPGQRPRAGSLGAQVYQHL